MVVVGPQTEVVTFQTPTKLFQAGRRDVSGSGGNEGCAAPFCRGVMPLVPVIPVYLEERWRCCPPPPVRTAGGWRRFREDDLELGAGEHS